MAAVRCHVRITQEGAAQIARCDEFRGLEGRGPSEALALERLRASIAFELELCPCDVTTEPGLTLEVVERG
jgi:hypothetical protein